MTLKRYLTEAELAAVQPVTGDEFDINLREITNIETVVVEHTEDAIMIELDDAAIAMLEEHGVVFEDDDQLNEFWPLIGAVAGRVAGGMAGRALAGTAGSLAGGIAGSIAGKKLGDKIEADDDSNESVDEYADAEEYRPKEGDIVRINYATEHAGKLGQVVELAPSGKFAWVEFKDGAIESYDASNLEKVSDEEADAYMDQEEIDELAPLKALAGLGSKVAKSAPSKAAGKIIKSAGQAMDKKMFGPRPHEEDYEESINGVKRLAGMPTKEEKTAGHDKSHGGPYDRGSADAYYGRPARPHKIVPYTGSDGVEGQMQKVTLTDPAEIAAYNAGYAEEDDRKDYGESVIRESWYTTKKQADGSHVVTAINDKRNPYKHNVGDIVSKGEHSSRMYASDGSAYTNESRFEEPVSGYRIVNKKNGQAHPGKFASKDAAQKHLMTKMFANHQDYEVKSFDESVNEAEYRGRKVALGKPMQGDVKKFKVYVKDPKTGNVKKVNFGDPNMRIKKSNPARRKSFRARHNCANPGPRTKARYWSCRKW